MSTKAPGEILELFRGGYLSMAETIDALDGVEGYVSVELLNIERTISDDLRAQNAKLREELRGARVPQMLRCNRCGSSGDVFMMCAGCQSPLASTAETLWEALEPFGKLATLFDEYEVDRRSPEKDSVLVNVKLNDLRKARALTSTDGGIQPHIYSPDYQAMGDCHVCGHEQDKPWHVSSTERMKGTK